MFSKEYSDKTLSLALVLSAAAWGLYWYPLRSIESTGMTGAWSVVFFNACPLIILCPWLAFNFRKLSGIIVPTLLASVMIGLAFTLFANGLVETTIVRATLLYYLTPVWSTMIGVIWLSERLTKARIIAISVAFLGLFLLLSNGGTKDYPLNIGDFYSLLSGVFWAIGVATLNRWSNIPILPLATLIFVSTTLMSAIFAGVFYADPLPDLVMMKEAFPTAAFWSIVILLPSFCIIFRVSQLLFPGRVGILAMSEVVVAITSASIMVPEESMILLQWMGAFAILLAGLIEVLFGYSKNNG
ncbi:MAG: drug/metabolite transporter (DMT)-like permease [Parasphingorhabdus sp.]